ncbi:glycosyltransferase family 2 protein [Roseomonas xinghualingensis]|uniref:glycosyltransferase family 2 protein n=1 Tax=Roseomonas xinghualingensis TaxID=2986475 RepID=UPI0021F0D977|nr:glycosyltransferase family 2 protein [Roseomonas sp. SXEYE001]MCV4208321.1 glycosyltransferase [Roseomonas sp. SXEYE001]
MNPPAVTVLMPAFNAEQYIAESIWSVLSQTFGDFEIVVVNDGSTDGTRSVLSGIQDPRLRIIHNERNLGIVKSLNRGFSAAQGQYVARLDADDYCAPHRLEVQKAFLDANRSVLMVGSGGDALTSGKLEALRVEPEVDPDVLRWLFHIVNPIGHSTMMFRRDAVLAMKEYLRGEFEYAEDFDFSHRLLVLGSVAMMPEHLVVFRRLPEGLSRSSVERVTKKTTAILETLYEPLLGPKGPDAAAVISAYLMAGYPAVTVGEFARLGGALELLVGAFLERNSLTAEQRTRVLRRTSEFWWQAVLTSARNGAPAAALQGFTSFRWRSEFKPKFVTCARAGAAGLLRGLPVRSLSVMRP